MIATPDLDEIMGAEVVDPNNDTVGKVGRIYLDPERDTPTWVSVKTGLFGLAETLVPIDDATWDHRVLHVTVDKAYIKDAPRVDADQEIAPEDQERLYSYYDRGSAGAASAPGDYGTNTPRGSVGGTDRSEGGGTTPTGALGGGAQLFPEGAPDDEEEDASSLGGGNQNPDADRESGPRGDAGNGAAEDRSALGGGNQDPEADHGRHAVPGAAGDDNPVGYSGLSQNPADLVDGRASGPGAGMPAAGRRSAEQDDRPRMRLSEDTGGGDQQDGQATGGAMRMSGSGGADEAAGSSGGSRPMRLKRYVVTEQQTVTMPVSREEYRLEPEEGRDPQR